MANEGQVIGGRDGTADVSIAGVSYKCVLNMFEVESNTELINSDVFCVEGTVDQEPGREQLRFRLMGLLKRVGTVLVPAGPAFPAAGPLIPTPQNVAVVFTYSTGCTISLTSSNFFRARAVRVVNQNSIVEAEGVSKGAFTVAWLRVAVP